MQLRSMNVQPFPDDSGNRAYEVRSEQNEDIVVLRLWFSPTNGDAIVRSEYGIAKQNPTGEVEFITRTVRTVEKWQELPGGALVPARFRLEREANGKKMLGLVRAISQPVIGDVDDVMFDTKRLPEFNVQWDAVLDVGRRMMFKTSVDLLDAAILDVAIPDTTISDATIKSQEDKGGQGGMSGSAATAPEPNAEQQIIGAPEVDNIGSTTNDGRAQERLSPRWSVAALAAIIVAVGGVVVLIRRGSSGKASSDVA